MAKYVRADRVPGFLGEGVQARGVNWLPDGSAWVAVMDTVPEGAVEISEAEYQRLSGEIAVAIEEAVAARSEPVPEPVPTLEERVAALEEEIAVLKGEKGARQ